MKWQVQLNDAETQHCSVPAQLSEGVPFVVELGRSKESNERSELESGDGRSADKSELESERYKEPRSERSERVQCVRRGRHVSLLHDIGAGLCLEEHLTILAQELSALPHGRSKVQVLYTTQAGKLHSCCATVGLEAVAMPTQMTDSMQGSEVVSPLDGQGYQGVGGRRCKGAKGRSIVDY